MNNDLTKKEIEIQEAFDGTSFDLDTSALWDSIEPQLPPEENKRRPIWWMSAGVIAVLILLGSTFSYFTAENSEQQHSNTEPNTISSNFSANQIPQPVNNSTLPISDNDDNERTVVNQNSQINTSSNLAKTVYSNNNNNNNNNNNFTNSIAIELPQSEAKTNSIQEVTSHSNASLITRILSSTLTNQKSNTTQDLPLESETIVRGITSIDYVPFRKTSYLLSPKFELNSPQIQPIKNSYWRTYIAASSGVNISQQHISSNTTESIDRTQFDKESGLIGSSSMIAFGKEHNNGWRFNIGLTHNRLVSRYSNQESSVVPSTIDGIESSKIDQEGNRIDSEGTININTINEYNILWHKNHDYVDLNLGIGKELFRTGRFSISTELSIGYNLWSQHEGYYFNEENATITKFQQGDQNPYKNQGISWTGRLQAAYDINNIAITISPYTSFALQNSTEPTNYYQIKNSQYGIQLGVVYRP